MTNFIFGLVLSLAVVLVVQSQSSEMVYVESWKKGKRKIQPQKILIELNKDHYEHEQVLLDAKRIPSFVLQIRHYPWRENFRYYYEYWLVDLCEYHGQKGNYDISKECLLLTWTGRDSGSGKHYFPKKDNVGMLYPVEEHKQEFMRDASNSYPLYTRRAVKIEGFYCIIQVKNYSMSQINPMMMDSLTVEIELTNDSLAIK